MSRIFKIFLSNQCFSLNLFAFAGPFAVNFNTLPRTIWFHSLSTLRVCGLATRILGFRSAFMWHVGSRTRKLTNLWLKRDHMENFKASDFPQKTPLLTVTPKDDIKVQQVCRSEEVYFGPRFFCEKLLLAITVVLRLVSCLLGWF